MSRGLSNTIITEIAKNEFTMVHLIKLEFNSTYYYTDYNSDVSDGSNTYDSNAFILGLETITESAGIIVGNLGISISGANQVIVSDLLTNGHLNRNVTIKRAFLNASNSVIANFSLYSGKTSSANIAEGNTRSIIKITVANHWAQINKNVGRYTNNSSQQQFFPNDKSFEFCSQTGKKIQFGGLPTAQPIPDSLIPKPYIAQPPPRFR